MPFNRKIIIFSPQRWSHLYVSKHHYAMELARNNDVWFISAPEDKMGSGHTIKTVESHPRLKLVEYKILLPQVFKFKMPQLYKKITEKKLGRLVRELAGSVYWAIDFGCYQFFNGLSFLDADVKIYFPVDDFGDLKPTQRGAVKIFSVSTNIVEKFRQAGYNCEFVNHGLSNVFAQMGRKRIAEQDLAITSDGRLKFGYSGNLFLKFLDIPVMKEIVQNNPDTEFHFFGSVKFDPANEEHASWWQFLQSASNVRLHGFMSPEKLAAASMLMDGFILCYKPDYKDYHAENSHKVFEYLSTGKVMVSTHLSLYEGSELIAMSPKDSNHLLPELFQKVLAQMDVYNNPALQKKRISAALDNTYEKQVERIESLCA